jgi:outer membrane receptor protein involved in Fe transport
MRLTGGLQGLMSYALQRAKDRDTGLGLVNSPAQMGKMRVSIPGPIKGSFLSTELLAMSSRRTVAGGILGPATTANVTLVAPVNNRFELFGTLRNIFDVQYADPASDSHRQDSIPQNGRTVRVGLRWKLWNGR